MKELVFTRDYYDMFAGCMLDDTKYVKLMTQHF